MKLFERLRATRELRAAASAAKAAGKSEEEVTAEVTAIAQTKFGDIDWGELIELVLKIIALLFNKPTAAVLLLVFALASTAAAQCPGGVCVRPASPASPAAPTTVHDHPPAVIHSTPMVARPRAVVQARRAFGAFRFRGCRRCGC